MADQVIVTEDSLRDVGRDMSEYIERVQHSIVLAHLVASRERMAADPPLRAPQTATAVMERPTSAPWTLPPNLPTPAYLDRAKRIGLDAPHVLKARMDFFLATNGWPVYPYDRVWAYLEHLAEQENQRVHGQPRRRATWEVSGAVQWASSWLGESPQIEPYWAPLRSVDDVDDGNSYSIYNKRVPDHALDKVEILERAENFGPGVLQFYVSDYRAVNPDPFLLLRAGEGQYVVDVWDEPGW